MRSLFPYVGGKHRVADRLVSLLPEHKCYVEVFMGAANVFFAKPPSDTEVINDINGELVNLFRIIRWHPDELLANLVLCFTVERSLTTISTSRG
jgi:DNA adenine methylase